MSAENPTASELLVAVNAAIYAIVSGKQSYQVGEASFTFADLGKLREMRKELMRSARTGSVRLGDIS